MVKKNTETGSLFRQLCEGPAPPRGSARGAIELAPRVFVFITTERNSKGARRARKDRASGTALSGP